MNGSVCSPPFLYSMCMTTVYILCPLWAHVAIHYLPAPCVQMLATSMLWNIPPLCGSDILLCIRLQRSYFIRLYLLLCRPENHPRFISFGCSFFRAPLLGFGDIYFEMEGSQQPVPFQGRRDIEAILHWFPRWYLSVLNFCGFGRQYSLHDMLIFSTSRCEKRTSPELWLKAEGAGFYL